MFDNPRPHEDGVKMNRKVAGEGGWAAARDLKALTQTCNAFCGGSSANAVCGSGRRNLVDAERMKCIIRRWK